MQNKNHWYHNLRFKALIALCVIMLLGSGLFIRPAQALAPSKSSARPAADVISDRISVVASGSNRLDVFATKSDGAIWTRNYVYLGQWSTWASLGKPANGTFLSTVEAVSWAPGRLDVFATDSNRGVWHKYWNNGSGWGPAGDWENLGNTTGSSGMQVVSWGAGRLDLFTTRMGYCISYENCYGTALLHKAFSNGWWPSQTGWESLDNSVYGQIYVVPWRDSPQWLHILETTGDSYSSVSHKYWNGASWSGWNLLNGFSQARGAPFALSWGSLRLDVFVRGMDGSIWHDASKGTTWTGWESLGGVQSSDWLPPTAVSWALGRLDVFMTSPLSQANGGPGIGFVMHKYWSGGAWGPAGGWENLGIGPFQEAPKAVSWSSGRLDLFGRNADGTVYHKWYQGGWGPSNVDWENLGAP